MVKRVRSFILATVATISFCLAYGQEFTPVSDLSAIRKKLAEVSQNTVAIKSDFVQEKTLSMISEKITSKGFFYFKKENMVRLEYVKPFKYLMVINNGKMLIRDDEKSTQMDMHKNKVFQDVNNIIINSVKGNVFAGTDFTVTAFENATQLKLDMRPLSKGLKDFFQSIIIYINKKDYSAVKIVMNEISGDNTVISFTNKEINGKIDDALFAVK
jgi:outer membrane lipoprotein-sorting protein